MTVVAGAAGDGFEDVSGGGEAGFDADECGVDGAGDDAAHAGDEGGVRLHGDDAGGGADDVDDVADAAAGADGVPVCVEGADGDGDAGLEAELFGPLGGEMAGEVIGGEIVSWRAFRGCRRRGDRRQERKACGGRPPHLGFHIHLWPMAQALRLTSAGVVMPARVAATMSQCSKAEAKLGAFLGVVAKPVEELGEAPLVRVDAAAPVDGFELLLVGEGGDLLRFVLGAVVAPEIVVVERLHVGIDGDDAGAGGIEGDGRDVCACDVCLREDVAGGPGEGVHLVVVRLRCLVGVLAIALEGVFGDSGSEASAGAVEERDSDAKRSEINPCHDGHTQVPPRAVAPRLHAYLVTGMKRLRLRDRLVSCQTRNNFSIDTYFSVPVDFLGLTT